MALMSGTFAAGALAGCNDNSDGQGVGDGDGDTGDGDSGDGDTGDGDSGDGDSGDGDTGDGDSGDGDTGDGDSGDGDTGGNDGSGGNDGAGGELGLGGADGSGGEGTGGGMGGEDGSGGEPSVVCADILTAEECDAIEGLSPLGEVPADPTNAYADNAAAAALGQMFFFDADFSGPLAIDSDLGLVGEAGKVACASCHLSPMMSDHRSDNMDPHVSVGANFHGRNAPAMVNSSFYTFTNWGGRFSRQWELPMPVTESPVIMNSSRLMVAHVIFDKYRDEYEAVFGAEFGPMEEAIGQDLGRFPLTGKPKATGAADGPWELMTAEDRAIVTRIFVNYAKALAAYTRLLVSRNAPFDDFVAGEFDALSDAEIRGLQVFVGPGQCMRCHDGPHFSDDSFHNIGVRQDYPNLTARVPATDNGRIQDLPGLISSPLNSSGAWSDDPAYGAELLMSLDPLDEANRGIFRTPSLRGLAHTAPYMHSGQFASLEEVIDFYDRGGDAAAVGTKDGLMDALHLTNQQKEDLLAFLLSLDGDRVPEVLTTDTSK